MRSRHARRAAALSLVLLGAWAAPACDDAELVGVAGTPEPTPIFAPSLPEPAPSTPAATRCESALDCPAGERSSSCRTFACLDGTCVPALAPAGHACTGEGLGECQVGRCAADGTCVALPADDGLPCRLGDWAGCQGFVCHTGACLPVPVGCDEATR